MAAVSPSSSPRLPSPPPFPEVQIAPHSPSPGASASLVDDADLSELDRSALRRIRPGTRASEMASGPPLVPLAELDSPFQLQEHLKAMYLEATRSDDNETTVPISRDTARLLAQPPDGVERALWLYELCRFLVLKVNSLIVGFFADNPPCTAKHCPEMRASEWQYLCAVHDPPKSCCAIDYCCHTLDWAANILTSQKHFPSRLTLSTMAADSGSAAGANSGGGSQASVRQLTNIFRRVYRMFAHAWFQHREVFWALENQEGIYVFYKTVCDVYQLIPEENYTVPPEAEGLGDGSGDDPARPPVTSSSSTQEASLAGQDTTKRHTVLDMRQTSGLADTAASGDEDAGIGRPFGSESIESSSGSAMLSTGATTRRHKQTPSTGALVTTIDEGEEEEREGDDRRRVSQYSTAPGLPTLLAAASQANASLDKLSAQKQPLDRPRSPQREDASRSGQAMHSSQPLASLDSDASSAPVSSNTGLPFRPKDVPDNLESQAAGDNETTSEGESSDRASVPGKTRTRHAVEAIAQERFGSTPKMMQTPNEAEDGDKGEDEGGDDETEVQVAMERTDGKSIGESESDSKASSAEGDGAGVGSALHHARVDDASESGDDR